MSAKTLVDVQCGLKFAKSPLWTGQKLLFLDVHDRSIKTADMEGRVQTVRALPYLPAGFGVLADGGLMVGDAWRRKIYRWETSSHKQMADLSHLGGTCLSDGIVDASGGMYVGDTGYDFLDPLVDPVPHGTILYVSADGKSSIVAENLFFPNGMSITPDNRTLIVAETLCHCLTAFEIVNDGSLQNRRVWAQFQDHINPDGICIDSEGAIWLAGKGPWAARVQEGGKFDQKVTTKRPVFAIVLGGPQGRHLFMCTSASEDPIITRGVSSATIDIADIGNPGGGAPEKYDCHPEVVSSAVQCSELSRS